MEVGCGYFFFSSCILISAKSEMSKYWLENQKQQDCYKKKLNKYTLSPYFHSVFSYQYFLILM